MIPAYMTVYDCALPPRMQHALEDAGFLHLARIQGTTDRELKRHNNIGPKTVAAVRRIVAYHKPFDYQEAQRRDAASPWKKEWNGPGAPVKPEDMPTYEEWKRRKEQK